MAAEARMPTGVPGLDGLIEGGLPLGGIYLVVGPPGSGKTILANQICYHHAREGRSAVYVTLLTESHVGMLSHLQRMAFSRADLVGEALVYYSGYKVLQDEGLVGLARMVGKVMADRSPAVLVVDGFTAADELAQSGADLKQLVRQIQTFSASVGCTTLLLSSAPAGAMCQPEHTAVDGILELSDDRAGGRSVRHLQVRKLRGTRQNRGHHSVEISDAGLTVYPRFESTPGPDAPTVPAPEDRCPVGVTELDAMMRGGLPRRSVTVVFGASGTGKTTVMLRFLAAGAARGETGLFFGLGERPDALLSKDRQLGLGVQAGVRAGKLHLSWQPVREGLVDVLAAELIRQLRDTGATRLCIDGLYSLFRTVDEPARVREVTAALAERLSALGVTTMASLETPDLVAPSSHAARIPLDDLSALTHNLIMLRLIERDDHFDHVVAIMKMRDSQHDRGIRAIAFSERGIEVEPARGRDRDRPRPTGR